MRALKQSPVQYEAWQGGAVNRFKLSTVELAQILEAAFPERELLQLYRERSRQR